MKPLIKWAGGKSHEIKHIKNMIPEFDRYIEPFFGGGALFFKLEPKKAEINDISKDLMNFYKILKTTKSRELFKVELYKYAVFWDKLKIYFDLIMEDLLFLYKKYANNEFEKEDISNTLEKLFKKKIILGKDLFKNSFCINKQDLLKRLKESILNKIERIKRIDEFNNFSDDQIINHLETSFRGGFYNHFRDLLNLAKKGSVRLSKEKEIANYYFIREFCYGSMFRFNKNGDFNIPYGGIMYNNKNWKNKIDKLFGNDLNDVFKGVKMYNLDFEEFLNKISPDANDFVFFDPPYFCEFSEYDNSSFREEDQRRLARYLSKLKVKFIMIIRENEFIKELYGEMPHVKIASFEKTYICNMRGRNRRKARHLIVSNF